MDHVGDIPSGTKWLEIKSYSDEGILAQFGSMPLRSRRTLAATVPLEPLNCREIRSDNVAAPSSGVATPIASIASPITRAAIPKESLRLPNHAATVIPTAAARRSADEPDRTSPIGDE